MDRWAAKNAEIQSQTWRKNRNCEACFILNTAFIMDKRFLQYLVTRSFHFYNCAMCIKRKIKVQGVLWTELRPPNILMLKPYPQCDYIWRQDFQKVRLNELIRVEP